MRGGGVRRKLERWHALAAFKTYHRRLEADGRRTRYSRSVSSRADGHTHNNVFNEQDGAHKRVKAFTRQVVRTNAGPTRHTNNTTRHERRRQRAGWDRR